jgi:putative chitinase
MSLEGLVRSVCLRAEGFNGAGKVLPYLQKYLPEYGITNPQKQAEFLSQCAHESAGFRVFEENLNYGAEGLARTWPRRYAVTTGKPNDLAFSLAHKPQAIANNVYANRMGNGGEASGDGWRFRGRGAIQITGRDNYALLAKETGLDCINRPEILAMPEGAIVSACWFWKKYGIGDAPNFIEQTRRINGGIHGLADRQIRLTGALSML